MSEVEALCYVTEQTTIPVPKVYRIHYYHGQVGIEMEYIQGASLHECWRSRTIDEKRNIMQELGSYIKQLKDLEPPMKDIVASVRGGPCREIRVGRPPFGPFDSVAGFHSCLRGGLPTETFGDMATQCHARNNTIQFTHGDVAVQNIMVQGGKIAAILDWGCAGWYPEYWEYTKAHYNRYNLPDFYQMIGEQMIRYDDELEAERSLWKIFDQPLDQPMG